MVDWNNCTKCGVMIDWREKGFCDRCQREANEEKKFKQRYWEEQRQLEEDLRYAKWKKRKGYN